LFICKTVSKNVSQICIKFYHMHFCVFVFSRIYLWHKNIVLEFQIIFPLLIGEYTLLETRSLPSACPYCTRQRLWRVPHSAKPHPAKGSLPSAVGFAECQDGTRQIKVTVTASAVPSNPSSSLKYSYIYIHDVYISYFK
jgi:hypothetical protein